MAPYTSTPSALMWSPADPAATTVAPSNTSVSRGSSARLRSAVARPAPWRTSATIGAPSPSATTTTWPAAAPHGTPLTVPLRRHEPPVRASVSRSPSRTGASVSGPSGTSSPAWARSQPAAMVSASGTGALCLPAARTTTWASTHIPPAPPPASGTSGNVRPPSSRARQSLSGHAPLSADSISSLVTRSVKSRVTVGARRVPSSLIGASSQSQPARDDAAQDLAGAAAQRERGRALHEVAERLLQVGAGVDRRLDVEQRVHDLRDRLLERRPHVLHHGRLEVGILPLLQHAGDRERHLPQRGQLRDQPSDDLGRARVGRGAGRPDQLDDERDAGEIALGPAPLVG